MHWFDTSANGQDVAVLCLHAPGQWAYYFRRLMSIEKIRWIIPDLIGFGRSDKPKRETVHEWQWHCDVLLEWLGSVAAGPLVLAYAEGAEPLAELLTTRAPDLIARASAISVPDERTGHANEAWNAPFPDRGHEAALRALGRADERSSGPSVEQAREVADAIASRAVGSVGYCRP